MYGALFDFFEYHKLLRIATVLISIFILILTILNLYLYNFVKPTINDYSNFEALLDSSIFKKEEQIKSFNERKNLNKKIVTNTSDSEYLYYRSKLFDLRNDVSLPKTSTKTFSKYDMPEYKIEINKADSLELEKLPFIGKTLSRRIVKFRESLGGFYTINQLLEVYGIDTSIFYKIKPFIYVDVFKIRKINLNKCTYTTLYAHPYFRKSGCIEKLLKIRKKIGFYSSKDELLEYNVIDSLWYDKLKWYIEI